MRRAGLCLGLLLLATLASAANTPAGQPRLRSLVSELNPLVGSAVEQCLEMEYRDLPRGAARIDWPLAEGFVISDLPPRPLRRIRREGEPLLLESVCRRLVPLRAGELSVPAARISRGATTLQGGAMTLEVRPLPATGRPAGFSGAVGSAILSLAPGAEGGVPVYDLTLTGDGPLDLFPPPDISPAGQHLQLERDLTRRLADGRMQRQLRYRAEPGAGPGPIRFSLSLFDPQTGSYRRLEAGDPAPAGQLPTLAGLALLAAGVAALAGWLRRRRASPEQLLAAWAGVVPNALDRTALLQQLQQLGLEPALLGPLHRYLLQQDSDRFAPDHPAGANVRPLPIQPPNRRKLRKAIDKLGPYRR